MSVNESFPTPEYEIKKSQQPAILSLNDVFKESMKKAQAALNSFQMIVRCENLPQIRGNYAEMLQLFDNLLKMILNHPPKNSKLFLYVDCEEDNQKKNGEKHFIIKFNTNIDKQENWKVINSQALVNCKQILAAHNGSLVVNNLSSTGCLFIVSLPGKME